jgi:hypothetical protein
MSRTISILKFGSNCPGSARINISILQLLWHFFSMMDCVNCHIILVKFSKNENNLIVSVQLGKGISGKRHAPTIQYEYKARNLFIRGKYNMQRTLQIEDGALEVLQDWLSVRGKISSPLSLAFTKRLFLKELLTIDERR